MNSLNANCLFSAEYHMGQLALRDAGGAYLSPIGSKAVLKTRSQGVTKDELFTLEDSLPQASFVAALNSRYVSVKQGEPLRRRHLLRGTPLLLLLTYSHLKRSIVGNPCSPCVTFSLFDARLLPIPVLR